MKIEFGVALTTEVKPILQEEIPHRGPQARRINTTTTLLVGRARTQTWSRVYSICRRRHVSPSPALMSFAPIACMHAFCRTTGTLKNSTKILALASRGTYPWSVSVELVILGVLNASLPSQSPELDFQPLELDKLVRNLDHLPRPKTLDDNLTLPRTPSPTMHSSFPEDMGRPPQCGVHQRTMPSLLCWFGFGCYSMTHFLTMHMCFCLRDCTLTQGYQHKKRCTVQRHANAIRNGNARGDGNARRDC